MLNIRGNHVEPAVISIDTSPDRAVFFNDSDQAFTYPAIVQQDGTEVFDFVNRGITPDFKTTVGRVSLELVNDEGSDGVDLEDTVLRGIAKFVRNTQLWGDGYDCGAFAQQATGIKLGRLTSPDYFSEVSDPDAVKPGQIIAVGVAEPRWGVDIAHWAIGLGKGMTANVTSKSGGLAGTPLENFPSIYTGRLNRTYTAATHRGK